MKRVIWKPANLGAGGWSTRYLGGLTHGSSMVPWSTTWASGFSECPAMDELVAEGSRKVGCGFRRP